MLKPRELYLGNRVGDVSYALLNSKGNIYLGVCFDIGSGIGSCAEHSTIVRIVAVSGDGKVLPPCGRCRELMYEIDISNLTSTEVILDEDRTVKLKELLPHPYHEVWDM